MTTDNSADIEAIRTLIEQRTRAVREKDLDSLIAEVEPAAISFDVVGPLQFSGADAARARAEEWFGSFDGPIELESRDLKIEASEDLGFCYGLNRIRGTLGSGDKVDMWVRSTVCLRKRNSRWTIVHQHTSVPFNAATGEAALDLKP